MTLRLPSEIFEGTKPPLGVLIVRRCPNLETICKEHSVWPHSELEGVPSQIERKLRIFRTNPSLI